MLLNIITPCTRLANLPIILESIKDACKGLPISVTWYIVADATFIDEINDQICGIASTQQIQIKYQCVKVKYSVAGHGQRNVALDQIKEGFIYFVDDDNILHPDLIKTLYDLTLEHGQNIGVICKQILKHQIRTIKIERGTIDMAQMIVHISLIGKWRFVINEYCADGHFIEDVYRGQADKFFLIQKELSYYNKLA